MIVSCILLIFLGGYLLYNTSKKAVLHTDTLIEHWIQKNLTRSKAIGVTIFIVSILFSCIIFGKTAGILFWIMMVSLTMGLIIIFAPLRIVTYKHLFLLLVILLIFEFIF